MSSASSVMPMIPFMGVRISWLIFARNSLFALLADSARLLPVVTVGPLALGNVFDRLDRAYHTRRSILRGVATMR